MLENNLIRAISNVIMLNILNRIYLLIRFLEVQRVWMCVRLLMGGRLPVLCVVMNMSMPHPKLQENNG